MLVRDHKLNVCTAYEIFFKEKIRLISFLPVLGLNGSNWQGVLARELTNTFVV